MGLDGDARGAEEHALRGVGCARRSGEDGRGELQSAEGEGGEGVAARGEGATSAEMRRLCQMSNERGKQCYKEKAQPNQSKKAIQNNEAV